MELRIIPHAGVDAGSFAIRFGSTREEVGKVVGMRAKRGRRGKTSNEYDYFVQLGFFVYYDNDDRARALEFARRAAPIVYDGYELFAHSAYDVLAWARAKDPGIEIRAGFRSVALGLYMYAPWIGPRGTEDIDEERATTPAEGFLVGDPRVG
jgi:hypothetical protein